jgi:RNA polymerase sigma factor (sigma-70 family)
MCDEFITKRTDGALLRAFRTLGDEHAFADLMRRHGRMVHNTARALVGNAVEAEDIAQSAFLALARKGEMLEGADSVSGWLYHVTLCLARNAYRGVIRRKAREEEAAMLAAQPDPGLYTEGVMVTLYEELGKLAEKYRQPVILHHLEGLDYVTAAPMCGCSEQAFSMRLTRGREKLRERLAKRGVALGITALIAGLSQSSASAAELPAALVASTCKAATAVAAGGSVAGGGLVSAKVAALTDSSLKLLFWGQVKTVAVVCAGIAVLSGTGLTVAILLTHPPHPETRQAAVVAPVVAAVAGQPTQTAAPVPMPQAPAEGRLVAVNGNVWVARADGTGQPSAASVGTEVFVGEAIVTGTNATAQFAYADGSTLQLYRRSAVVLSRTDAGPELDLRQGAVDADIRKQPDGCHLRILGKLMHAEIEGAEFRLMAGSQSRWLGVRKGVMAVSRVADDQKIILQAGDFAVVDPNWPYLRMNARFCPYWQDACRQAAGTPYP